MAKIPTHAVVTVHTTHSRDAVRPILEALVAEHGTVVVVDELAGATPGPGLRAVVAALVQLCGWDDLVRAVADAHPHHGQENPNARY